MFNKKNYNKKWREEHPDYNKKWREEHENYYKEHREQLRENTRKWNEEHPDYLKNYWEEHRESAKETTKKWRRNNKERAGLLARKCSARKRATPQGNLEHRMAVGIWLSLRKNKAGQKWEGLVGYTIDDLIKHLGKQFKNGLTWEIFFEEGYHIDHIKPKSLFHYETPEDPEFKECWALENLQPLEAIANIKKSNHYKR